MLFSRRLPNAGACSVFTSRACIETLDSRRLLTAAVWTGLGTDSLFSDANNWAGNVVPASGQDLVFPAGVSNTSATVDGTWIVGSVEFDAGYVLTPQNGNASLRLNGNVTSTVGNSVVGAPIALEQTAEFLTYEAASLTVNSAISTFTDENDPNNYAGIIIEGNGPLTLAGSGETYNNNTAAEGGVLDDRASIAGDIVLTPNSIFNGSASIHNLYGNDATISATNGASPAVVDARGGINLNPGGDTLAFDLGGPDASSEFTVPQLSGMDDNVVDLNDATLACTVVNGYVPHAGDVITLIQNDTGPVNGTFANLPEGAATMIDGTPYAVSYLGGSSGHDVTLTVLPQAIWTGAAGDGMYSTAANWQGDTVPASNAYLEFDNLNSNQAVDVDQTDSSDVAIGNASISGNYTFSGPTIGVYGNIDVAANANVTFTEPIFDDATTFTVDHGATLTLAAVYTPDQPFDPGAVVPEKNGDGTLVMSGINYQSDATWALNQGTTVVSEATTTRLIEHGGALAGDGTVYNVTVTGGTIQPTDGSTPGTLTVASNFIMSGGTYAVTLGSSGNTEVDQGAAGGVISLSNSASLSVALGSGFTSSTGNVYTIVSNNGGSAVIGAFDGLAEGAMIDAGGRKFSISYVGGTSGHDITLTDFGSVITVSTISLTSSHVPVLQGQHVTLTATVAAGDGGGGTPTGIVTFYDNGTPIGTAQTLVNGTAAFNDTNLPIGADSITATYSGDSTFAGATTPSPLIASVRPNTGTSARS